MKLLWFSIFSLKPVQYSANRSTDRTAFIAAYGIANGSGHRSADDATNKSAYNAANKPVDRTAFIVTLRSAYRPACGSANDNYLYIILYIRLYLYYLYPLIYDISVIPGCLSMLGVSMTLKHLLHHGISGLSAEDWTSYRCLYDTFYDVREIPVEILMLYFRLSAYSLCFLLEIIYCHMLLRR